MPAGFWEMLGHERAAGRRVLLPSGCFDVLHIGHVSYLAEARALGDILIVGLNSDESVRRLKGPGRPINPSDDRAGVLAALRPVDHVVVFPEATPHRLIEAVRPDVFVKGGDYDAESLPERPLVESLGGRVEILGFRSGRSSTAVIDRLYPAGR